MSKPEITKADCEAAIRKHGSQAAAARALGMSRSTFQGRLSGRPASTARSSPKAATPSTHARSLAEFRNTYDKDTIIPKRINEALEHLGKDGWAYEAEFVKIAGVSLAHLGSFRTQFADYVVSLNRESKRAWAGSKALAEKMKSMLRGTL